MIEKKQIRTFKIYESTITSIQCHDYQTGILVRRSDYF
jgi:hypothetical protein